MTDIKATMLCGLSSILGVNLLGFAGDAFIALLLGGVGALGGWLANRLIKYLEKRHDSKKKKI